MPFVVVRDGQRLTIPVTLGNRPPEDKLRQLSPADADANPGAGDMGSMAAASLGLKVVPITPSVAYEVGIDPTTKGVIVAGVAPNSDAASKIQRLDVILSVNRKPIASAADIAAIVAEAKKAGRNSVALYIQRRVEGQVISQFIPVEIPR
ncbi:MAG: hypothetical protein EOP61_33470 [Sphingomonadales bacterium]|nr:MAG: hypothetical protein EOP61_33470 [Sphingomonadales bacterium]